ncbi:transcriptional regulator, TetR family [Streptoalloteichus tenebrarius]|uniref:Transcriptional regulator, TetR family n=1 Tax=Streptoalloteichus tenebrarius (strain ATCC 17920 / DSM 40477 / JCM 4838 / CBS 697.72 / NBRC 16177 / NCIMB 11028 / NRRL B-12390 / A12253. 1 / ISP 5477) TaxID=1933 RepID=A0ABT1HQ50_STRSD|nr:TetR/AcrR family transcriptional regulator [Streptoalloteichus tenebrarius]MCP2257644.1 transcriptional regulator, TetR family [Streptoalloteichus tenebrarius]
MSARERILEAAARLLAESGGEPVSTRAILTEAGVGAPTLYHHFGDKEGLFEAVVRYGFEEYLARKRELPSSGDPVEDLRRGWDAHVEFGCAHPAFYALMYGRARPGRQPSAATEATALLVGLLERVARAGLLRVEVEWAARMIESAVVGVTLRAIAEADERVWRRVSELVRQAVFDQVLVAERRSAEVSASAEAAERLLALPLGEAEGFSAAEVALLREWLSRLAGGAGR